ncbi:hypothetical protein THAOC_24066, partial [Thalassiosira oceanica]
LKGAQSALPAGKKKKRGGKKKGRNLRDFKSNVECQAFIACLGVEKEERLENDPDAEANAEQAAADLLAELGMEDLEGPSSNATKKKEKRRPAATPLRRRRRRRRRPEVANDARHRREAVHVRPPRADPDARHARRPDLAVGVEAPDGRPAPLPAASSVAFRQQSPHAADVDVRPAEERPAPRHARDLQHGERPAGTRREHPLGPRPADHPLHVPEGGVRVPHVELEEVARPDLGADHDGRGAEAEDLPDDVFRCRPSSGSRLRAAARPGGRRPRRPDVPRFAGGRETARARRGSAGPQERRQQAGDDDAR